MSGTSTITVDGKQIELPVKSGTIGPDVVDISKLYAQTGAFTFDPGFTSTASCESKITYIDGDEGVLLYRGYPIEQLAEQGDFLETCYLMLFGTLPTEAQKADFDYRVTRHTMVHDQMNRFFTGFRRDAHPMAVMVASVGALSAFYHDSTDITDENQRLIASIRMIAKMPTLAAMAYKYSIGQPFVYPKNDLDYTSNFLRMCYAVPCEEYEVNPVFAKALDKIFILHADHEQNASTSTVRLAGSSGANPFACIAAGIACLWGPAHGGANEAALKMLMEIGTPENVGKYVAKAKDKNDPFRLMGFGHRVYKNYDPRARLMQKVTHEVLKELGHQDDPLLEVAVQLEQIALKDEYFIEKKLYPNIDFYSGITLKAMGFPTDMFTVLFAVARTVGWIAQWAEMIEDPQQKIGRPRQLYVGPGKRDYAALGPPFSFWRSPSRDPHPPRPAALRLGRHPCLPGGAGDSRRRERRCGGALCPHDPPRRPCRDRDRRARRRRARGDAHRPRPHGRACGRSAPAPPVRLRGRPLGHRRLPLPRFASRAPGGGPAGPALARRLGSVRDRMPGDPRPAGLGGRRPEFGRAPRGGVRDARAGSGRARPAVSVPGGSGGGGYRPRPQHAPRPGRGDPGAGGGLPCRSAPVRPGGGPGRGGGPLHRHQGDRPLDGAVHRPARPQVAGRPAGGRYRPAPRPRPGRRPPESSRPRRPRRGLAPVPGLCRPAPLGRRRGGPPALIWCRIVPVLAE
ncbi:hypothetical protein Lal_00044875 [Lupinus albus]|nr:hypothetical protein Lal_00044875 [Lupinus albus]